MTSGLARVLDVAEYLLLRPRLCAGILFVVFIGTAVMSFGPQQSASARSSRSVNPTALEMMHVAFVGRHSLSEIEAQIRRAAAAFNIPGTDQNFSRMGSALVALRKESRVPEMELLRCARAMREEVTGTNVGLDFPSAASMCAATLMR